MDAGKTHFIKTYGKQRRKIDAWISPDNRKLAFDSSPSAGADSSVWEAPIAPEIRMESATYASRKGRRPAKRKASVCQKGKENMYDPSPAVDPPVEQKKKYSRWTTDKPPLDSSESDVDVTSRPKRSKVTAQRQKKSSVAVPSVGRFVTLRRAAPPRAGRSGKASYSFLNSSAEFVASRESTAPRQILRAPQSSAVDVSEPHRPAVSPPDAAERGRGPSPRKPLFCSTPSVSLRKGPCRGASAATAPVAAPPHGTVSHLSFFSTSQEDLHSPGDPFHAPNAESRDEETGCPYVMDGIPFPAASSSPVSSDPSRTSQAPEDTDDGGRFVSASVWPEWMLEVFKQICLTKRCTVALERVENLIPGPLPHRSAHSSRLDRSSSGHLQKAPRRTASAEDSVDPPRSEGNGATPDPSLLLADGVTERRPDVSAAQFTDGVMTVDDTTCSEDPSCVCIDSTYSVEDDEEEDDDDEEVECKDEDQDHQDTGDDRARSAAGASSTRSMKDSPPAEVWGADPRPLLKDCRVQLQRASLSLRPAATAPRKPEAPGPSGHAGEQKAKRSSAPQTGRAGHRRDGTSAAPRPTPPLDPGGQEPAAAATPPGARFTKPGTPGRGPAPGSGTAPDRPDPNEAKRPPSKGSPEEGSSEGVPEAAVAPGDARPVEPLTKPAQRKVASKAPREKRKRSSSRDQGSGTARKACISGLSVSRWKDRSNTSSTLLFQGKARGLRGAPKAGECSFTEPLSTQHKPSTVWSEGLLQGGSGLPSTPVRAYGLSLSSVLADLTPNTHTWSRLKAALSVHRRVVVTPSGSCRRAPFGDLSMELFATPTQTPYRDRIKASLLHSSSLSASQSEEDLSDAEKVYSECGQQGPLSWEESVGPHRLSRCVKIGEGTFGEVFSTTNASDETVAIKIIPVEGSETVNGEPQKTFGEILHEIIISKELSNLRNKTHNQTMGFIGLKDLHCVRGCYPPAMLQSWDAFNQRKGSENDRPDFFDPQQLFLILEFEFGGSDLENCNGTLSNLSVAKSILYQVTAALAVAEQELCFEHRDLHWGNVLVKTTKAKKGTFLLDGKKHSLDTKGVLVHVIDFSLSRLEIDGLTVSCDISNDEELFMGQGDHQFDIYRLMRQANGNDWGDYRPRSNVMWLQYLSGKLRSMKYRGSGGRAGKRAREDLAHFYDNVLQYSSATEALRSCPLFQ